MLYAMNAVYAAVCFAFCLAIAMARPDLCDLCDLRQIIFVFQVNKQSVSQPYVSARWTRTRTTHVRTSAIS
jgi:hypothetical protein